MLVNSINKSITIAAIIIVVVVIIIPATLGGVASI